jgi:hypothetical protein
VDLRYDNQIIVNPEMQRTAKPAPALSPAVAKAAVAAGVKPAALVTRLGAHDRAVPKPAFELTEKKISPEMVAGGASGAARKTAAKSKGKKIAGKSGKAAAGATKAAAGKPATSTIAKNTAPKKPVAAKPAPSSSAAPKPSSSRPASSRPKLSGSGGQKPSPAVAKSQTSQGPGQ